MTKDKDAIGAAILDFAQHQKASDIIVSSDICDDDVIPVAYLFRSFDEMPELEKIALNHCVGSVLEVGAGAGMHAKELIKKGHTVTPIDISPGAVEYMRSQSIPAQELDFNLIKDQQFDTVLLLMNGLGIAQNLNSLESFLRHAQSCLKEHGKIICDSTNVMYLYEDDEGGMWMDLNSEYYGDFKFKMSYNSVETDWFDWLYVDYNTLVEKASNIGLNVHLLFEDEEHYLVELTKKNT